MSVTLMKTPTGNEQRISASKNMPICSKTKDRLPDTERVLCPWHLLILRQKLKPQECYN